MEGSVAAYLLIMGNKPKQIMEQESTCVFFFVWFGRVLATAAYPLKYLAEIDHWLKIAFN